MAPKQLVGKRVLLLAGPWFEDSELLYPLYRLREEGAEVVVAGLGESSYTGKKGHQLSVAVNVADLGAGEFDAMVIPGGYAPDHFRRSQHLLDLVAEMYAAGKPVAAICHGPWLAISAGILKGRQVTGSAAIRDDVINAGGNWIDAPVVVDDNLISSRHPDDLGEFCREIIAALQSR